jgi:DNA-binding response OmpR family regulator
LRILIIEDENLLADSLQSLLTAKGFAVDVAYDGEAGEEYAELGVYDLLILDIMLPKMDGYEVARRIRSRHLGMPILMLTAKSELEDRIVGLNSGADYYLTKPFDTRELLACINALLRRQGAQVNELVFGNTTLDLSAAMLICGENSIRLSAKEFEITRFLFQAGDKIVSKEIILDKVWGFNSEAIENNVEVYIGFLRKKLASIGSNIRIEAIRRLGYHLEVIAHDKEAAI